MPGDDKLVNELICVQMQVCDELVNKLSSDESVGGTLVDDEWAYDE